MSFAFRFTGIMVLGLAAIAASIGIGGGSKAQAAGASIDCEIPNNIECVVSHPSGIANVTVSVDFGPDWGVIEVVDKNFACQPSVMVSWDPIVPNYDIDVTPCPDFGFKGDSNDDVGFGFRGSLVILAHSDAQAAGQSVGTPFGFDTLITPEKTIEICHLERDGTVKVMDILPMYLPQHEAHGDVVASYLGDYVVCLFNSRG